jgi:hypothetical protein
VELKVYIFDFVHIYISIRIDHISVETFENIFVPLDNDLASMGPIFRGVLAALAGLVLQLLKNVVEVIFVLHDT